MSHFNCTCPVHNRPGHFATIMVTAYKCSRLGCETLYFEPVTTCKAIVQGKVCGYLVQPTEAPRQVCVCDKCLSSDS